MPYLGRGLEKGNYLKLDDISSQFDGSKTTFNLTVGGSAHVPGSSYSLLVSLSGIVQEGEAAYTLDQNEITFAAAPQAADDCFIVSLGTPLGIGVPSNGTVNGTQLAKPLNYDNFFHLDHTNDRVGIGTSLPTESLDVYDGNIAIRDPATASQSLGFYHNRNVLKASIDKTGNNLTFENVDAGIIDYKIGGSSRVSIGSTGKIFFGTDDNTYFHRPGADTLEFINAGVQRFRLNSSGNVGIGTDITPQKLSVKGTISKISGANGTQIVNITNDGSNNGHIIINDSSGVTRTKLDSADVSYIRGGNLGINDMTPRHRLTVNSAAINVAIAVSSTDAGSYIAYSDNTTGDTGTNSEVYAGALGGSFVIHTDAQTTPRVAVTNGGNIGIGTTNPYYNLEVNFNNSTTALSGGASGNWGGAGLRLENENTTVGSMSLIHFRSGNNADWHIGTKFVGTGDSDIVLLQEGVNEKLRIKNSGLVGIGTTNPSQELTVYGADPIISVQEASVSSQVDIGTGTVQGFINIQKADGTRTVQISSSGDSYFSGGDLAVNGGNLDVSGDIRHIDDTDTKIAFTDNQIDLKTGGHSRIYASNSAIYVKSGLPLAFLSSSGATPNIKSGGTNNQDLLFTTGSGNPTRLQITSDGKVGINTITPNALLHLRNISAAGVVAGVRFESSGNGNSAGDTIGQLEFVHQDSNAAGLSASIKCVASDELGNVYFAFNTGKPGAVSERLKIDEGGKLWVDRTHASATTGDHPVLDLDTYANGTAGTSFATGIDFRVAGVHKKRMIVTNGSGVGAGDWAFYRDNGTNRALTIAGDGNVKLGHHTDITNNAVIGQTNLYMITASDMTAVDTGIGAAANGVFRIHDRGGNNNRYHGIDLRNTNDGDCRILNKDLGTTNSANMVFSVDDPTNGQTARIIIAGADNSVQIYGATSPQTGSKNTPLYFETNTDMTGIDNPGGGNASTGLFRIEDRSSSNNRYHGIDIRNRNSGDIRILNLDGGASNKCDFVIGVDGGPTFSGIKERFKINGANGSTYINGGGGRTNLLIACAGTNTAYGRIAFSNPDSDNAANAYRIDFWEGAYSANSNSANGFIEYDASTGRGGDGAVVIGGNTTSGANSAIADFARDQTVHIYGSFSAASNKGFLIPHPIVGLSTTKELFHTAIEGPQSDLIYRGKNQLSAGTTSINIDTKSGMTEGTFVALCRDVQCFTTNETGWTAVKGSVSGNIITITAQDNTCTDIISWMVVGERQDPSIKSSANKYTDTEGNLIPEHDMIPAHRSTE